MSAIYTHGLVRWFGTALKVKVELCGTGLRKEWEIIPSGDDRADAMYANNVGEAIVRACKEGRANLGWTELSIWVAAREDLGYERL